MISGIPTLQSIVDLVETEGCPYCGELPGWIDMVASGELVLEGSGHVVDAKLWIDAGAEPDNLQGDQDV